MAIPQKQSRRVKRHRRIRAAVRGTRARPRLSVYRSSRRLYLQLIDDAAGKTLLGVSDAALQSKKTKLTKSGRALQLGKLLAQKAAEHNIKKVVFDRGGYRYHGRVAQAAQGAREGGLEF